MGEASITYQGQAKPFFSTGTSGVSVTGMAGAAFSKISIIPVPSLDNTELVAANAFNIYGFKRGVATPLLGGADWIGYGASFSHTGLLAYMSYSTATDSAVLGYANYDGTNPHELNPTPTPAQTGISYSPVTANIIYANATNLRVYTVGGTSTSLTPGLDPAYSPDGTKVAYCKKDASGYYQVYVIPAAGGAIKTVTSFANQNSRHPCWSGDGNLVAFDTTPDVAGSDTTIQEYIWQTGTFVGTLATQPAGTSVSNPVLSVDNKRISYTKYATAGASGYSVMTSDLSGDNAVVEGTLSNPPVQISRSPYFGTRVFVGPGGAQFTSAAAGFLFGQNGTDFVSFASFTATTPSTATVTQENAGGGAITYDIHADAITGFKYTNAYYSVQNSVTVSGTDALVVFDSESGNIATIAPFVATRGVKPMVQTMGKTTTLKGSFSSVFDSKGKNIAPSGARMVSITGTSITAN